MKNLAILTTNLRLYSVKRFVEEASKLNLKTSLLNPYQTHIVLNSPHIKSPAFTFDYVLHRITGCRFDDFDLDYLNSLKKPSTVVINSLDSLRLHRTKLHQLIHFKEKSIPAVPSMAFRGEIDLAILDEFMRVHPASAWILKMERGNQGKGVNLVQSKAELLSWIETLTLLNHQGILIQPFQKVIREFRAYVLNHEIVGILIRETSGDGFKANYAQSAKAVLYNESNQPLINLVEKTYQSSGCFYASIDILETPEGFQVLEVNSVTGFEQFEMISQMNFAQDLLSKMIELIR